MEKSTLPRDTSVDIVKGLGILLVVVGHSGCPATRWIYLFHLAAFFAASGYCCASRYSDSAAGLLLLAKKRILSLYVPYVVVNSIYIFCNNLFILLGLYSTDPAYDIEHTVYHGADYLAALLKVFRLSGVTTEGGATWFLRVLLAVTIGYAVLEYLLKKLHLPHPEWIQLAISLPVLWGEWYLYQRGAGNVLGVLSCASAYFPYCLGKACAGTRTAGRVQRYRFVLVAAGFIVLLCGGWMTRGAGLEPISLNLGDIYAPAFYAVMTLAGWLMLWALGHILACTKAAFFLVYIGRSTLPILFLHFLCFKLVTWVQIQIYALPFGLLASHPVLNRTGGGWWWVAYVVVGMAIPLAANAVYQQAKHKAKALLSVRRAA